MVSGAGHDSQVLGRVIPTVMVFVPSRDGRSHSPAEYTPLEQVIPGVQILADALYASQVNVSIKTEVWLRRAQANLGLDTNSKSHLGTSLTWEMIMREVCWERMFPDELEEAFARCPLVYFTYGLCEPHGPQNTLGLDSLKAHAIACEAARAHGGIVAPPDYWHIHELGGYAAWAERAVGQVPRTWLTAVPPWVHFKNVCYHIRAADALGFHAAILITGHYGPNWQDLKTLIDLLQPHVGARLFGLPDFEANQPGFDGDGKSGGDHAGRVETSLLWALDPECVDVSRVPATADDQPHFAMGKNVRESNRLIGERMVADEVRWLGAKARELLEAYDRERPRQRLRTFEDVEVLWETVVRPNLKEFRSMQDLWSNQEPVPEESVWHANWRVPGERF